MSVYRSRDIELFEAWKANPNEFTLEPLLKQLDPLIMSQVRNWSGTISEQRLRIRARALAKSALETYDPSKGAISTHLTTRLQKLSRDVYPYQNAARLPEHQQIKYRSYAAANSKLEDDLGRPPTAQEMSEELNWGKGAVMSYGQQLRGDFVASEGVHAEFHEDGLEKTLVLDYVYHDLTPSEKVLFERITGYRGAKIATNNELMKDLNLSQGQLSYMKRKLIDKVSDYQRRFGS